MYQTLRQRNAFGFALMLAIVVFSILLVGCAQLGLQKPETTQDKIGYSRALVSSGYKTVGDLTAAKTITVDQGRTYFNRLQDGEKGVNTADQLLAQGKPADAQAAIATAMAALEVIRDELAKRAPPK